ncbi:AAA family ATPase [Halalkalibacillus halophilus]|uniref:AAA family ATPase n=1 Tax=Halalkalibacillus halophilus TaxID=392827 RepID=UPI001FDF9416|nr:AAA family ATPase [Halalkalibacillus halophilus]
MVNLTHIQMKPSTNLEEYPFNLPLVKQLDALKLEKPVTILVGDNGTGKSTLLEAIASEIGSILIGGEHIDDQPDLEDARKLAEQMKLIWKLRTKTGFFFRATDFVKFVEKLSEIKKESAESLEEIKKRDPNSLEVLPYARTLSDLQQSYGDGLEFRSHGESFLDLFQARFKPGGLYILDEPEAPLSPLKQLSLISMIKEMVKKDAQFIIATHSPILMAIPEAQILAIEEGELVKKQYDDLEHVTLTRDFLNHPERFLRHL